MVATSSDDKVGRWQFTADANDVAMIVGAGVDVAMDAAGDDDPASKIAAGVDDVVAMIAAGVDDTVAMVASMMKWLAVMTW